MLTVTACPSSRNGWSSLALATPLRGTRVEGFVGRSYSRTMTGSQHEVLIVRYGTRTTTRSDVFLNYHAYGEPDGPMEMDYFFWVIQGDAGPVVGHPDRQARAGRLAPGIVQVRVCVRGQAGDIRDEVVLYVGAAAIGQRRSTGPR